MKNLLKFKGTGAIGIATTVLSIAGAVITAINDQKKTKTMEELIDKVTELTNK